MFQRIHSQLHYACLVFLSITASCLSAGADEPTLAAEKTDSGARVTIDGELFTEYVTRSGNRPILWPVIGPTGSPMTRSYPMTDAGPDETTDHIHHRSMWFGYEGVNGANTWHEAEAGGKEGVLHRKFARVESDEKVATIVTNNDYVDAAGKVTAHDERTWRFGSDGESRWIDSAIKLWSSDGPLVIGDTKEGALAVRVAGTMKVDAGLGGKIITSRGDRDTHAWGKPAEWVDYSGPVDGQTVGIAMFAHPSSCNPTPRWHVRTYGLFAANPFGAAAYTEGKVKGGFESPEGEPVVMRHRIFLHRGDEKTGGVAKAFEEYAETE